MLKLLSRIQVFLSCLIGAGAFFGGMAALIPGAAESMGLTTAALKYAPFQTFLLPGLFLLLGLSVPNLLNAFLCVTKKPFAAFFSAFMGVVLILWIVVQCLLLWTVTFLHVLFLLLGCLQLFCGAYLIGKLQLPWPLSAKQN